MPCISCKDNIQKVDLISNEWISRDEVKELCPTCYENMIKNNITKIKKITLLERLKEKSELINQGEKMKFTEVMFTGSLNQKFNLGYYVLEPFCPIYLRDDEIDALGLDIDDLKAMPKIQVDIIDADKKPDPIITQSKARKALGQIGVIWQGPSPERVNELGRFPKGVVVWVKPEISQQLIRYGGFRIV